MVEAVAKKNSVQLAGKLDKDTLDGTLVLSAGGTKTVSEDSVAGFSVDIGSTGYHPGDVTIEQTDSNSYTAYRKTPKGNEPVSYPEHRNGERLEHWARKLSDSQLDAAIQIYYDRWAFGSGEAIDKIYFDSLDAERTRRRNYIEAVPVLLPSNDPDTGIGQA